MKDQINTAREGIKAALEAEVFVDKPVRRALLDSLTALAQLEAMVGEQEPVAKLHDDGYWTPMKTEAGRALNDRLMRAGSPSIDVYAAPVAQQPQAEAVPQNWRIVLPGGKHTDKWESARVADYNQGWNDYRKAANANLKKLEEAHIQTDVMGWVYTLEYGANVVDRKISLDQLRYPFGVCGADYLRANDDGVSYVRETPLVKLSKTKEVPPTHVLVPVELLNRVLDSEEVNDMADASDELRAMLAAAKKEAGHE